MFEFGLLLSVLCEDDWHFQNEFPGPGTYGVGGVPHRVVEEKSKKSASTVGILDAGSSGSRTLPTVV